MGTAYIFHKITRKKPAEKDYLVTRGLKVFAMTLSIAYFSIVVVVVQMFGCTGEDVLAGKHYLNGYLYF